MTIDKVELGYDWSHKVSHTSNKVFSAGNRVSLFLNCKKSNAMDVNVASLVPREKGFYRLFT